MSGALEAYSALRADGGENGKQIKSVLERLRADPGKVRGESLRYRPDAWMVVVEMARRINLVGHLASARA